MDVLALGIWYDSKISSGQGPRGTFAWRTWAQVWAAVDNRIAVLRDLGLGPGHVVAVHLERSEEFLLTVAAAESAIGLAILVVLFRQFHSVNVEDLDHLRG